MKKVSLKLFLVFLCIGYFILSNPTNAKAVLQSNGGTSTTKNIDDWMLQIREMEGGGGTLGLNETINTTGLLSTTESNGLDCHMEKNTEYGAMVLLSASSYGNPKAITNGGTTTGNSTGVVMNINKEWVAAGAGLTGTTVFKKADARYINNDYGTTAGGKYHIGDAMAQGAWHTSSGSTTWFDWSAGSGLLRSYKGSVFSYFGNAHNYGDADWKETWSSRAVIVIGSGL